TQMVPGLNNILGGLNTQVIPGLEQLDAGIDQEMTPGLDKIVAGLKTQVVPGLKEMKTGIDTQMIPGLDNMLFGFNKTEAATGESGIVEGLSKVSRGLANPEFSPNPGGDPGISDGLGLVIDGIYTGVLDGIESLKSGIVDKIMPGLEQIGTGISDELQPGFNKVSLLLLVIWLVSMAILLVVGFFIGRAGWAKSSAGSSSSV
ncbi:MAG TPA: hypothetical protein PKX19_01185, partial [Bacillota bacterium]|nr:hypothetical protein [Bacillota bacterium]